MVLVPEKLPKFWLSWINLIQAVKPNGASSANHRYITPMKTVWHWTWAWDMRHRVDIWCDRRSCKILVSRVNFQKNHEMLSNLPKQFLFTWHFAFSAVPSAASSAAPSAVSSAASSAAQQLMPIYLSHSQGSAVNLRSKPYVNTMPALECHRAIIMHYGNRICAKSVFNPELSFCI